MTTRGPGGDPSPAGMSARDMDIYEQLMKDGIAAAARRRSPIDHVTARRTAIWLASRPAQPEFRRNLLIFIKTGELTPTLKTQLRNTASRRGDAFRPHAARLWTTPRPAPTTAPSAPTSPASATRSTRQTRCSPGSASA